MTAEAGRPALVLVVRCTTEPAVPSTVVTCAVCREDCWLSVRTGPSTVALARSLSENGEIFIMCTACLDVAMAAAGEQP